MKMRQKAALVVIVSTLLGFAPLAPAAGVVRPNRHSECSNRHYQRCMRLIYHLSESNMEQTTVEELNKLCRKWQQTVACIDHHQARCFSEEQSRLFNQVLATPRQYLSMLCGNPQLQQEYLKFAQCDANITKDESKCGGVFRRVLHISQDQPPPPTASPSQTSGQGAVNARGERRRLQQQQQENVERVLSKNCCAFDEYLRCKKRFLTRDCGDNASQFFETHIKRISAPFAEEQCGAFVQRCAHASLAMPTPMTSVQTGRHLAPLIGSLLLLLAARRLCSTQLCSSFDPASAAARTTDCEQRST